MTKRPKTVIENFVGSFDTFLPKPEIDEGILQGLAHPIKASLGGEQFASDAAGRVAGGAFVTSALLFLISAVYKRYKRDKADKIADALMDKATDFVDAAAFIKKNLNVAEPIAVMSSLKDLKGVKALMVKAGVDREQQQDYLEALRGFVHEANMGNAFVMPIVGGLGNLFIIIAPKRVPRLMIAHEMGHIKYAVRGRSALSFKVSDNRAKVAGFLSRMSRVYDERAAMGTVHEEMKAWELAGIPKDNPWRKAAMETYRAPHSMNRALMKLGALATVPIIAATVLALKSKG